MLACQIYISLYFACGYLCSLANQITLHLPKFDLKDLASDPSLNYGTHCNCQLKPFSLFRLSCFDTTSLHSHCSGYVCVGGKLLFPYQVYSVFVHEIRYQHMYTICLTWKCRELNFMPKCSATQPSLLFTSDSFHVAIWKRKNLHLRRVHKVHQNFSYLVVLFCSWCRVLKSGCGFL